MGSETTVEQSIESIRETLSECHEEFFGQFVDEDDPFSPNQLPDIVFRQKGINVIIDDNNKYKVPTHEKVLPALAEELDLINGIEKFIKEVDEYIDKRRNGTIGSVEFDIATGTVTGFEVRRKMVADDDEFVEDLENSIEDKYATAKDDITPKSGHPSVSSPLEKARYAFENGKPIWSGVTKEKLGEVATEAIHKNNFNTEHYAFKLMLTDGVPFFRSVIEKYRPEIPHPNVDLVECAIEYIVGNKFSQINHFTKKIFDDDANPRDWVGMVFFEDTEGNEGTFHVNSKHIYSYNYDVISEQVPDLFGIDLPTLPSEFDSIYMVDGSYTEDQLKEKVMTDHSVAIYKGTSVGSTEHVLSHFQGKEWDYISDGLRYCKADLTYLLNFNHLAHDYEELDDGVIDQTLEFLNEIINMNIGYYYADFSPAEVTLDKLKK